MAVLGRPVLSFLDSMYSSQEMLKIPQRDLAEGIKSLDIRDLTSKPTELFKVKTNPPSETTTSIQYLVNNSELETARKLLGKSWSASKIGRHTFEYFLKSEKPE
jgi:hypothetical protein